jgi:endonuclease/exonuclease/phosphatase family metal-dependent hydrolase
MKIALVVLLFLLISCIPQQASCPFSPPNLAGREAKFSTNEGKIMIASFNIEIFGATKAGKPEVVKILADIGNDYDVLAVQEFRDSTGETIQFYLDQLNSNGENYDVLFSKRLGRSNNKEQYAFYYDTNKFEILGEPYIFEDIEDIFEREPFLAYFKSKQGNFDFVLVNIHTKPDDATNEINALASVVEKAKQHFNEKDIIVLGDYNADGNYFKEKNDATELETGEYTWLICDDLDTTVAKSTNTYDRIVVTPTIMEDFAGEAGVRYYDSEFGLTQDEADEISDHFPVYAVFSVFKDTD